ncbi:hypothetical protein SB5439_04994 [Klebsiella variicola]|uniref:terminase small subunit n=1 Tax=Klebsiella variicola TaxID=244366 RepID=UPI00109C5F8D|nr:terminase small subunit [Klebsiella variicola]VGQ11778.1 hypothetical protein SB5439_04994 [Klebsiella variicola]
MLTARKKKYIAAILGGATYTQAAILAGYSQKTAAQIGYQLSKDSEILAALQKKWLKVEEQPVKLQKTEAFDANNEESYPDLNQKYDDPIDFLRAAMNNPALDIDQRKDAAKALLPYLHSKKGEGGKKDAKSDAAKKAASRFVQPQPPRLVANNG